MPENDFDSDNDPSDEDDDEGDEDEDEYGAVGHVDAAGEPYYYFDLHPTREDLMGSTSAQSDCRYGLMASMAGLAKADDWFFAGKFGIYRTRHVKEYPIEADVLLIKRAKRGSVDGNLSSWKLVLPNKPPPEVAFEVSQPHNWRGDLHEKPLLYGLYGVREYFAYDPHHELCWDRPLRLYGWRYERNSAGTVTIIELQPNDEGWLWSEELASWLVPEGHKLTFYNRQGQPQPVRNDWYAH